MIKRDENNRGNWKIEIIDNIFMGKDNTIRSIITRTRKRIIERPVQLLYPMELHCGSRSTTINTQDDKILNIKLKNSNQKDQ